MTYLVFTTEAEAQTAIERINHNYGCSYNALNGYIMEKWADVKKAPNEDKWYFPKPETRIGVPLQDAMDGVSAYHEVRSLPQNWIEIA